MIGTTLTHYRITAKLGEGGMGEVYRATDSKLGRDVAIKVLPATISRDAHSLTRFEREAKALAALNHPHIAGIYGFDVDRGTHFLVLELVEGETLSERLRRGPLPLREALAVGRQIAEAIQEAHEKSIIHRDLKPGNVKIASNGRVKVLDFGLAKMEQSVRHEIGETSAAVADADAPTMPADRTQLGAVMGTPAYMSPEQARGLEVDKRTDIWAFGCCLFECLSGHKPFAGKTTSDLMAEVLKSEPDWSRLPAGTPREVVTLLRRCLEKEPLRRLSSMGDIALTLEETARAAAAPASGFSSRDKPSVRWLRPALAGVVLLSIVAGGLAWWSSHPRGTNHPAQKSASNITSLAVKPLDDFSGDTNNAYLSDGMTEALCAALGNVSALRVPSRSSVMRYKGGQKSIQEMAKELNVEAIVEGSVQKAGSNLLITVQLIEAGTDRHVWATNYQRDLSDFFKVQNEVAQAIAGEVRVRLSPQEEARLAAAPSVNPAAVEAYLRGRFQMASSTKEGFEQSLASFHEALQIDPKFAKAYAGVADAYVLGAGWWVEDSVVLSLGFQAATNAVVLDPHSPEAHSSLGWYQMMSCRGPAAEESFKTALDLNPRYARALSGYGWLNLFRGRSETGLSLLVQAQESDPGSGTHAADVAFACIHLGRYDMAASYLDRAFKLERDFWLAQGLRGLMPAFQGNYPEAILWGEKAVQSSPGNQEMLGNLGWIYGKAGESTKARATLKELRTTSHSVFLCWVYLGLDQKEEAIRQLQEAVRKRDTGLMYLRFDRRFDPLRQDPRFPEILRFGLEP
jgi:serine/threonine protein kinase/tetratricopeptide (TPR) repeat protein